MNKQALEELRARVRAATGPDRELDFALRHVAVGAWLDEHGYRRDGDGYVTDTPPFPGAERCCGPEMLTFSIDAGLALCEQLLPGRWSTILRDAILIADGLDRLPLAIVETLLTALIAQAKGAAA